MEKPQKIAELRRRLRILEKTAPVADSASALAAVPFGVAPIDGALPWGGLPRGSLHEVSLVANDIAAHGFAAALLGRILKARDHLLWCRVKRMSHEIGVPYGPGLGRFGVDAARTVFVETENVTDALWAMEEGLRTGGLAAVYGEGVALDLTSSRRLQLAAESSGKTALVLASANSSITAATTRWRVTTLPSPPGDSGRQSCWSLALTRCRGGAAQSWMVTWDHETHRFSLAAPLADRLLAATAS